MQINVGKTDRKIRLLAGLIMLGLSFTALTGVVKTIIIAIGIMVTITAFTRFCLPYYLFGINTCERK